MNTKVNSLRTVVFAVAIGAPLSSSSLWAAEEKALRSLQLSVRSPEQLLHGL